MHAYVNLLVHIVFSTKDRRRSLNETIRPELYRYIGTVIKTAGGMPVSINGVSDHIHLLSTFPQDRSLADVIRDIKSNSSTWLKKRTRRPFAWQTGYAAFAVSASNRAMVAKYINNQERHHTKRTFLEELDFLLRAHNLKQNATAPAAAAVRQRT